MKDVIFRRKSCRSYTDVPVDAALLSEIEGFLAQAKPLYPEIKTRFEAVGKDKVRSLCPFLPPQLIAAYSENAPGYLENIGFLLQQLDLYLQKQGIGVCWIGLGKPSEKQADRDGMGFVILLAFGHPAEDICRKPSDFVRKPMHEISDTADERLEPARLAPSAVNSQPWYFTHEGDVVHVYRVSHGLRKALTLGRMNQIDMGIALAQLYVTNPNRFTFSQVPAPEKKGYHYIGSVTL